MRSRRNKSLKKSRKIATRRYRPGKKWVTALDAAQRTLSKTGSVEAAKKSLKKQALTNARKLFGSVGSL